MPIHKMTAKINRKGVCRKTQISPLSTVIKIKNTAHKRAVTIKKFIARGASRSRFLLMRLWVLLKKSFGKAAQSLNKKLPRFPIRAIESNEKTEKREIEMVHQGIKGFEAGLFALIAAYSISKTV